MFRHALLLCAALCAGAACLGCPTTPAQSREYRQAWRAVERIAEFKAWRSYVAAHPPARIVTMPERSPQQVEIRGKCFTSITVYSDEGTHLHRWNTFYVQVPSGTVLVGSPEGEPITLREWRQSAR
jgi:hypothetical protein